ncbi:CHC2 zinc finger domain-containing protein [Campylobacter sp. RM12651]|uniref:CHC2 zinc finger domain-containing protein n=1 Tax=Campylobacter sp. RM12651 TaxID=1660079 RepID=UPI001EFB4967|nr:CHC2 zinc finger domain-containing protein [Campylobacter sp. RM12651]ULO02912.1 DNA primase [Campylobacter sp. RM12651]
MNLQELKDTLNIFDIANSLGLNVAKNGTRFWTQCPFHADKNPSFILNADKNFGYCFTCNASADAFKLVMHIKNCDFNAACEYIASYYNTIYESKSSSKNQENYESLEQALSIYQRALNDECKEYLKKRGINEDSIKTFKLGYGVRYEKQEDELKLHLFNNRLIIPIFNNSKLVGFGGRSLEKNPKIKYINSPESVFFKKSQILFGLNANHIKKQNSVIIVEGYFDVILAHQKGFKNVVATLGTALNDFHIKRLSNLTNNIIFLFDNDNAGMQTSLKIARTYINNEFCKMGIIDFKGCKDLGELLLKDSECLSRIKTKDLALFLCQNEMLKYVKGENNINIINNIKNILEQVSSNYLKSFYRTKICETYNLDIKYFSLSVKSEKPTTTPNLKQKSEIEASILNKCLEDKNHLEYTKTYLKEVHFLDFFDSARKVFTNQSLDESELAEISIYANKKSNLEFLIGYKLKDYSQWLIKEIATNKGLDALDKAKRIQKIQEDIKKLNAKVGLNAR